MTLRCISKQLLDIERDPPPGISARPVGEDLLNWEGLIAGPSDTFYEGGIFRLMITFPHDYPFHPPKIVFTTRIYHPYIDYYGNVCCNILQDDWCPALSLAKVLLSIQSRLSDFNDLDNAVRLDAADLYRTDPEMFENTARAWTEQYAIDDPNPGPNITSCLPGMMPPDPNYQNGRPSELLDFTDKLRRLGESPSAHSANASIWHCTHAINQVQEQVAVKVIHVRLEDEGHVLKMRQLVESELNIRKELHHPNILGLLGMCHDFGPCMALVSPWMMHGDVNAYLLQEKRPVAHKIDILRQVSDGLHYLHSRDPPIVHGGIKAANVLIGNAGQACIAGTGHSQAFQNVFGGVSTMLFTGSLRSMAPELIVSSARLSVFTDIYALGSLVLEVLAQCIPYPNIEDEVHVVMAIYRGETPERPDHPDMKDEYWLFIQHCWSMSPQRRPTAAQAYRTLASFTREV